MGIRKMCIVFLFISIILFASCNILSDMEQNVAEEVSSIIDFDRTLTPVHTVTSTKPVIPIENSSEITPTPSQVVVQIVNYDDFVNLLKNNRGCDLPCLLGITPGRELIEEEQTWIQISRFKNNDTIIFTTQKFDIYEFFSSKVFYDDSVSIISLSYETHELSEGVEYLDNIHLSTYYHSTTDDMYGESIYGDENYIRLMEYFLPNNILRKYGKPTEIYFSVLQPNSNSDDIFFLGFFYDQHQSYIEYEFSVENTKRDFTICPDQGFVSLWSWRIPLGEDGSLYPRPLLNENLDLVGNYWTLNQIEGVSNDDIYESFTSNDNSACFLMPGIN